MNNDDLKKKKDDDDILEAASDAQDATGPSSTQDPMSPHSIAPQVQDEEAEKADAVEEAAGAHPEPPIEEVLEEDLNSTRDINKLTDEDKKG